MHYPRKALGALTLVSLLAAGAAVAQETPGADGGQATTRTRHGPEHMQSMQTMEHMQGNPDPMMRVGAYAPPHLLQRREVLRLTEDQVERLEALSEDLASAHEAASGRSRAHHEQLMEAWSSERPDADALEAHTRAAMGAQQDAHVALLRAAAAARGVLSAEQRGRVEGWLDARSMMERRPMHGQRMERMERMEHRTGDHARPMGEKKAPQDEGGR